MAYCRGCSPECDRIHGYTSIGRNLPPFSTALHVQACAIAQALQILKFKPESCVPLTILETLKPGLRSLAGQVQNDSIVCSGGIRINTWMTRKRGFMERRRNDEHSRRRERLGKNMYERARPVWQGREENPCLGIEGGRGIMTRKTITDTTSQREKGKGTQGTCTLGSV